MRLLLFSAMSHLVVTIGSAAIQALHHCQLAVVVVDVVVEMVGERVG